MSLLMWLREGLEYWGWVKNWSKNAKSELFDNDLSLKFISSSVY